MTKAKKSKKSRPSGPSGPSGPPSKKMSEVKLRKLRRKQSRSQKKVQRNEFYAKRKPSNVEALEELKPVQKPADDEKALQEQKRLAKIQKLEKDKKKSRKKQLMKENEAEEKTIRRLEKQLKMNKRKGNNSKLPASFKEDGLDYLLDLCDGGSKTDLAQLIQDDERESHANSDDDQDGSEAGSDNSDENASDEEDTMDDGDQSESDESMDDGDVDNKEEDVDGDNDAADEEIPSDDDMDDPEADEPDSGDDDEDPELVQEKEKGDGTWEDIYGRTRDGQGNVVRSVTEAGASGPTTASKYIPPALRAKLAIDDNERRSRLRKQVKGQLNRLAESNLHIISRQIEDYYLSNSRNDMNEVICQLMTESLISDIALTPERLVMEHAVLVAILHANVGTEVGASIVQTLVKQFEGKYQARSDDQEGKELDNYVQLLSQLYAFKVVGSDLMFGLLEKLASNFNSKDVELILQMLKSIGFLLRRDDPVKLKALILNIQDQSKDLNEASDNDSRIRFMLEALMAIKNNNVKKIPNYDPALQQHLQKIVKSFLRQDAQVTTLKIGYKDLLEAETRGRWWIVGSAWSGAAKVADPSSNSGEVKRVPRFSMELLDLARKMRMNTETRKSIFCSVMSSEDYLEATERLLKLPIKTQKEREIIFVILACCLKEKNKFNPFYSQLVEKLGGIDRKYRIASQYAVWDKIKDVENLKNHEVQNLAQFTSKLIQGRVLDLSSLKVVEFSELNKATVHFLKQVLKELLYLKDESAKCEIFASAAGNPKLSTFREGMCLFMRHFMLKTKRDDQDFVGKVESAEKWLFSGGKKFAM